MKRGAWCAAHADTASVGEVAMAEESSAAGFELAAKL
jgi:hypothetical protein